MRVINKSPGNNEQSENNKFGAFSCPSENRQESSLAPSKASLIDMPKSRSNKRRIIMSDDEDEEVVSVKTPNNKKKIPEGTPSSVEWVDSRKPSNMTHEERQHNVQLAIENRKQHGINVKIPKIISKIPKVKYTEGQESDEDDNILNQSTPYASKAALQRVLTNKTTNNTTNKFKSNLLNETFYEEQEDILEMKRTKREQDRSQRHENRTFSNRTFAPKSNTAQQKGRLSQSGDILLSDIYATATTTQLDIINLDDSDEEVPIRKEKKLINTRLPSIKSTKKKEIIELEQDHHSKSASSDSESSDSSSGSENGYRSDMDKSEIQALAHKVVRQCEDLSANLRKSLIQWESGGKKENTSTAAAAGSSSGGNCVELTSITPVENNSNK